VALHEVWESYEAQHGTSEDIFKVEAMKPIVSKRQRDENGHIVEGIVSTMFLFF
jgi:hypothetical protein